MAVYVGPSGKEASKPSGAGGARHGLAFTARPTSLSIFQGLGLQGFGF